MDSKKTLIAIVLSGLVYLAASQLLNLVTMAIAPFDWTGIGGMRGITDPLLVLMFFYGFVASIGAVVIYQFINLKGNLFEKGVKFGWLMWIVTSIPSAFIIYTTMLYPAGFYLNNIVFGLIDWVLMGIVIAWVFREKKPEKSKKK